MGKQASTGRSAALALMALVSLDGCASPSRLPSLSGKAAEPVAAPQPPAGASASLTIPALGADGRYATPNRDLSPAATLWHVRSALNVAALGCRGPQEATLIADYNRLLASKRTLLASAFARTEADARATAGKNWRDVHDQQMTRVYNFFAQPPAKAGFCAVAPQIAAEAATTPPAAFQAFADAALPRLEAPFLDFYRAYDVYRRDLAAWRAGEAAASPRLFYAPIPTVMAWAADDEADRRLAATDSPPRP